MTWENGNSEICLLARWQSLALLVHNCMYRHTPSTHTLPNTLSTTATLLHLSNLSSFTVCRKRRLSYEVFSDKKAKETPKYSKRETERQRERRKGIWGGGRGRARLTQIEFTRFSYIDLKQIFTVSAIQATGSEISPSTQAPEDLIQTGCPSLTLTGPALLWEDVLIIYCAEMSCVF